MIEVNSYTQATTYEAKNMICNLQLENYIDETLEYIKMEEMHLFSLNSHASNIK